MSKTQALSAFSREWLKTLECPACAERPGLAPAALNISGALNAASTLNFPTALNASAAPNTPGALNFSTALDPAKAPDFLICPRCQKNYPVIDNIPALL